MRILRFQPMLLALFSMAALPVLAQDAVNGNGTSPPGTQATLSATNVSPDSANPPLRIDRFQIKGNTLLSPALIDRLLTPYQGNNRSYSDIQRALETLEGAYRSAGYSAVHVTTPEQEITDGTITLKVIETVVGKVILKGNRHYDSKNIRNALPSLAEGFTPSARDLSQNLRLANENPTRQLDVVLALGEEDNTVDAQVNVDDSSPHKVFVTLDNTGSTSTGMFRTGVGYQNNNLFNRDHAATFNYVTSPGHVSKVTQLSASYRIPLYSVGDSIDFIAAHSDTNAGTTQITSGPLTFSGKGNVYGVHYNLYLPRQGDYISRVVAGLDYRGYFNNCTVSGTTCPGVPDINVHPVSLTYGGTLTKAAQVTDFAATVVHNLPGGARGGADTFGQTGRAGIKADYTLLRLNGSVMGALPQDWQYRVAGNLQYTQDALISYESFGLVGANAVRGFLERDVSNDKGGVLNLEIYTPELAPRFNLRDSSLRILYFLDRGRGWKVTLPGEAMVRDSVGSVGFGFRYSRGKTMSVKFDWAKVTQPGGNSKFGDSRGQINLMASW